MKKIGPCEYLLTRDEVEWCALAGVQRQLQAMTDGLRDAYGFNGDPWGSHINGCVGELVVAAHLNVVWLGKNHLGAPDVGDAEETRCTKPFMKKLPAALWVFPKNADNKRYWLVVGEGFRYRVVGWAFGRDVKQQKNWHDRFDNGRPNFWLEQHELTPANDNDRDNLVARKPPQNKSLGTYEVFDFR